jgi:uncharacterized protein (TIGR00725 family)
MTDTVTIAPERLPMIGVMGSGTHAHEDKAVPLGRWLAAADCHLLTGGGGGVMSAVSHAFCSASKRKGRVVGVLPGDEHTRQSPPGYPNPWVEIPIRTHLPLSGTQGEDPMSRNHINVLSADVIVALPGSAGTSSETRLALRYRRPVIAFIDRRADIPELSPEIPAAPHMEAVAAFISKHVGRAP